MQIALSTTLLVGAGLLTRAVSHAMSLDPGFAIAGIQEMSLELPRGASLDDLSTIREVLATSSLPPMAFSVLQPITSARMEIGVRHPNQAAERNRRLVLRPVSANYFDVLSIPFVTGRPFGDHISGRELVISESAARLLWPNDDPIGKRLVTGASDAPPASHEIVGVVADVPTATLTEVEAVIYQPAREARFVLLRDPSLRSRHGSGSWSNRPFRERCLTVVR